MEDSNSISDTDVDCEIPSEKHNYIPSNASVEGVSDRNSVNVKQAEAEFQELSRELSNFSQRKTLSRTTSKKNDIEQTAAAATISERETFDLEAVLRGNQQMELESGIKSKQLGVIWEDLTVSGGLATRHTVETFGPALLQLFNIPGMIWRWFGLGTSKNQQDVNILSGFRGLVKPGEMCLVLGNPGSGCTTFLKVISNQRFGYSNVAGKVFYGPFDAGFFGKRYRGEAVYNQEDDVHHATLTVGQTLGFALDLKTPGKRPAGMSKAQFKQKVIDLLLRMFNIEHTRDTLVGGPFVRGISGGERKRVSIAEMMVSSACICAYDQSTRGLDASTASDYAKSLRIQTNVYSTTTFVSLYQASETIYSQFDKVLVIDQGRQVYFGPTSSARAYFEGLGMKPKPRQTTPDYLVAMTDPYEREYQEGHGPHNAPHDTESLVKAWQDSAHARELKAEMAAYHVQMEKQQEVYEDFKQAHLDAKRGSGKNSVYSAPMYLQIWEIMKRQALIKWQDKFALSVSWSTMLLIAIVLGTTWLQLPLDSPSTFTRGGLIFLSLLFNAFTAFGELAGVMMGRALVNKQKAFTLYRPSSLWLAQIFVDTAFASVQILVFSLLVYFLCGLARTPGAFFIFYLMIVSGYLSMTVFFRTIGCLCPDFDVALRTAVVIITLYISTSGYLIAWDKEQVWLRWIFYINGLALGFASMMINEFMRISFVCSGLSLIPSGPGYTDIDHQVCAIAGSKAGTDVVAGIDYVSDTFNFHTSDLWRNWAIMVALIIFFLGLNVLFGELIRWGEGGRTITFFAKETREMKQLNKELAVRRKKRGDGKEHEYSDLKIASKAVLTWESLTYDVPVGSGTRRLLSDVFGYVKPGTLTALMGASGAGKTTLLDVLAARKNIGTIGGSILVDAVAVSSSFARSTSYAEQLDVHEPTATVREALRFSADLRQPVTTPQAEKYAYVEEVISLLEMENIADAVIGTPEAGLAVEARKRVTIGIELAAKPELLLFLDEPTSGLDSSSAFNIVRFLKKLAASGQAILCTVHQPNSALFESFDRLLLLQAGGECVYFGDIGRDASVVRGYFSSNGANCPADANPAEWMLDAIGAGLAPRIGDKDWGQVWRDSPELANTKEHITRIKEERVKATDGIVVTHQEYATPLWHQLQVVFRRTTLSFWRSPNYCVTRVFNHASFALLAGLVFLRLNDSLTSLQAHVFVVFQITVLPALIISQVEPRFEMSRLIFYRESAAKAYSQLSFAITQIVAEMPYSVLCAAVFFLLLNYLTGMQAAPDRAGYQFLMILIVEIFSVTLGQMLSAITPSTNISARLNPPILITFALFCGVTIPAPQMPAFWRAWLYPLDPYTHLIAGSVTTELHGRQVNCLPQEFNRFTSPPGQTCGEYMARFFADGGLGYIASNDTSNCEYCAYSNGEEFYGRLALSYDDRWRDLGIMACFIGSNIIIIFLASRYLNFNRR